MYQITDITSRNNQILKYLELPENGIIGLRAVDLIKERQKILELNETGKVDYATFLSLRDEYLKKQRQKNAGLGIFRNPSFPYRFGSVGGDVGYINYLLSEALSRYTFEGKAPRGIFFGRDTENAIERLREIYLLPSGKLLDEELFLIMQKDII